MDYKQKVYDSYRSTFKGSHDSKKSLFVTTKMVDSIKPWISNIDKTKRVCDLGCGSGELLRGLKALNFSNLYGCDISNEQVLLAQVDFPNVVVSDIFVYLESHFDNFFDIIILYDVIEHFSKQDSFDLLDLIYKKLSVHGILIVHTLNGVSPFVGNVRWGDITHEWCVTPASAKTLCLINGFVDFQAKEHLGASANVVGVIRFGLWRSIKLFIYLWNIIETGNIGDRILTRNFIFSAKKLDKLNPQNVDSPLLI